MSGTFLPGRKQNTHVPHTEERIPQAYYVLERLGFGTGAFKQLTRKYAEEKFNPTTPDVEDVRYVFSQRIVSLYTE